MSDPKPRLCLVSPVLAEPDSFAPMLSDACDAAEIAAVVLRLAPALERTLINHVKLLAPLAQGAGAAALVSAPGEHDLAAIALRAGADGVHAAPADWPDLRGRLREGRILGAGELRTKHEAMQAGEAGVDYVMFGEPRPDGYVPPTEDTIERAQWWAEIFETPCVAYAPTLKAVGAVAATGAEFVALGDAVWAHADGVRAALREAMRQLQLVPEPS